METFDPLAPLPRPVRFRPDPLDTALVAVEYLDEPFRPEFAALIYDESPMHGCALVMLDQPNLIPGNACLVKVGRLDPLAALIAWKRTLDDGLVRLGLQYLE